MIAVLASRTHGVVTRAELLRAGITVSELKHRLGTGALIREYLGVYRVGHRATSLQASYLAAVRAGGDGATLGGRAAAYLYGILKGDPPEPEVLTPTCRRVAGLRTRRVRLDPRDVTTRDGIPVTTIPRTIVDLAAELDQDDLARFFHEAAVRYRVKPEVVEAVLARRPNARGASALRCVIRGDEPLTLSKLEERFLELLVGAGLPLPETNRPLGGHYVDCRWPQHRLTVELDSYRYHSSRHAWENDHRRERQARARGDDYRRYVWEDIEQPAFMLDELRGLLPAARKRASATG